MCVGLLFFFVNFAILNKIIDIMNTLDLVVLVIIVISAIYGYYKGVLSQLGSVAGVFFGIICCRLFGDTFSKFLTNTFADSTSAAATTEFLNNVIAHVLVFVLAYLSMRIVASMMSKILSTIKLGVVNRVAGAIFAPIQWLVILSLLLNVWIAISPDTKLVSSSAGVATDVVVNLAPDVFGTETAQEILNAGN